MGDNKALESSYKMAKSKGYKKSIEEFSKLLSSSPEALQSSFSDAKKKGYKGDIGGFQSLLGLKKKGSSDSQPSSEASPSSSGTTQTAQAPSSVSSPQGTEPSPIGNVSMRSPMESLSEPQKPQTLDYKQFKIAEVAEPQEMDMPPIEGISKVETDEGYFEKTKKALQQSDESLIQTKKFIEASPVGAQLDSLNNVILEKDLELKEAKSLIDAFPTDENGVILVETPEKREEAQLAIDNYNAKLKDLQSVSSDYTNFTQTDEFNEYSQVTSDYIINSTERAAKDKEAEIQYLKDAKQSYEDDYANELLPDWLRSTAYTLAGGLLQAPELIANSPQLLERTIFDLLNQGAPMTASMPSAYEMMTRAGLYEPIFQGTYTNEVGDIGRFLIREDQLKRTGKKLTDGYTMEEIQDGGIGNIAKGNYATGLGLLQYDVGEGIGQLGLVLAAPEIAIPLMSTSAAGAAFGEAMEDPSLSTAAAVNIGLSAGVTEYVLESVFNLDIKQIKNLRKYLASGGKKKMADAIKTSVKESNIPKKIAAGFVDESSEELLAEVSNIVTEIDEAAKKGEKREFTYEDVLNVINSAVVGGIVGAVPSIAGGGVKGAHSYLATKWGKSKQTVKNLREQKDAIDQSLKTVSDALDEAINNGASEVEINALEEKKADLLNKSEEIDNQQMAQLSAMSEEDAKEYQENALKANSLKKQAEKATTEEGRNAINAEARALVERNDEITSKYDSKKEEGIPSAKQEGKTPEQGQPQQETGTEETEASGVVQEEGVGKKKGFNEGVESVKQAAEEYLGKKIEEGKASKGRRTNNPVYNIYEKTSKAISDAYDKYVSNPNSPRVKKAYDALVRDTKDQFEFLTSKGVKIEKYEGEGEPYANSKEMLADIRDNNRLLFLPSEAAFGDNTTEVSDNVGLQKSGVTLEDGYEMTNSELFRVVHDYFGHGILGNQFGAIGEENATLQHIDLFSEEALPAVIFQTRGQNSWVNFSEANKEAKALMAKSRALRKEGKTEEADKVLEEAKEKFKFAEPKIGVLPNKFNYRRNETARRISEQEEIDGRPDKRDSLLSKLLEAYSNKARRRGGVDKRDVRGTKTIGGFDVEVKSEYTLASRINDAIKKAFPRFKGVQKIYEITDGKAYREMMLEALKDNKFKSSVTIHSEEDFNEMRLFVTEDGSTGITLTKEGFLGGAFSNPSAKRPNNLAPLLVLGIKEGATTAEAFDTVLPDLYSSFGFKAVSRTAFNEEFMPEGWDFQTYKRFNNGRPDVVFFIYDGGNRNTISERIGLFDLYSEYEKENTKSFDKNSYDAAETYMKQQAVKRQEYEQEQESLSKQKDGVGSTQQKKAKETAKAKKEDAPVAESTQVSKNLRTEGKANPNLNIKAKAKRKATILRAKNAAKAISKILPDVNIVLHETNKSFEEQSGTKGRGAFVDNTIHVNLTKATGTTVAHEVFHAVFLDKMQTDESARTAAFKMMQSVGKALPKSSPLAKAIDELADNYDEQFRDEERLAELVGLLADNFSTLAPTTKSKVIDFFKRLAEKIGVKLGETFGETDQSVLDLLNTIATKTTKGEVIEMSEVEIVEAYEENADYMKSPASTLETRRQGDFEVTYTENDNIAYYLREGYITQPKNLSFLDLARAVITSPDDMLAGQVKWRGKEIFEGSGGIFFVTKFGEIWASGNEGTAKIIVNRLNEQLEENGVAYLVLTKGTDAKLVSSASGVLSSLAILNVMLDEGIVSASDMRASAIKGVRDHLITQHKKLKDKAKKLRKEKKKDWEQKAKDIDKEAAQFLKESKVDIKLRQSAKDIKKDIAKYFEDPSTSTFEMRGLAVRNIVGEVAKSIPAKKKADAIKMLGGDPSKGVGKGVTPKSQALVDLVAGVASEKLTKGLNVSDVYGVIEIREEVEVVKSPHPSYEWFVSFKSNKGKKLTDKKWTRPVLHLPQERPSGKDVLVQDSEEYGYTDYAVRNISVVTGQFNAELAPKAVVEAEERKQAEAESKKKGKNTKATRQQKDSERKQVKINNFARKMTEQGSEFLERLTFDEEQFYAENMEAIEEAVFKAQRELPKDESRTNRVAYRVLNGKDVSPEDITHYESNPEAVEKAVIERAKKSSNPKAKLAVAKEWLKGVRRNRKSPKVTMSEKQARREWIKALNDGAKNAINQQKDIAKELKAILKDLKGRGKITAKQAQVLANKALSVVATRPSTIDSFVDYAGKVFANADYAQDLSDYRVSVKRALKIVGKKGFPIKMKSLVEKIKGIKPEDVDIDQAQNMMNDIMGMIAKIEGDRETDAYIAEGREMVNQKELSELIDALVEQSNKAKLSRAAKNAGMSTSDYLAESKSKSKKYLTFKKKYIKDNDLKEGEYDEQEIINAYEEQLEKEAQDGELKRVVLENSVSDLIGGLSIKLGQGIFDLSGINVKVLSNMELIDLEFAVSNYLNNGDKSNLGNLVAKAIGKSEMKAVSGIKVLNRAKMNLSRIEASIYFQFGKAQGIRLIKALGLVAYDEAATKANVNKVLAREFFIQLEEDAYREYEGLQIQKESNQIRMFIYSLLQQPPSDVKSGDRTMTDFYNDIIENVKISIEAYSVINTEKGKETVKAFEEVLAELEDSSYDEFLLDDSAQSRGLRYAVGQTEGFHEQHADDFIETELAFNNNNIKKEDNYTAIPIRPNVGNSSSRDSSENLLEDEKNKVNNVFNNITPPRNKSASKQRNEKAYKLRDGSAYSTSWLQAQINSYSSSENQINLMPVAVRQAAALNSKYFNYGSKESIFRDSEGKKSPSIQRGHDFIKQELNDRYTSEQEIRNSYLDGTSLAKWGGKFASGLKSMSVVAGLGGTQQLLRQSPVMLNSTFKLLVSGDFDILMQTFVVASLELVEGAKTGYAGKDSDVFETNPLIRRYSVAIRDLETAVLSSYSPSKDFKIVKGIDKAKENLGKLKDKYMVPLVATDRAVARASFLGFYSQYMKKQGVEDVLSDEFYEEQAKNPNEEAVAYALEETQRDHNVSLRETTNSFFRPKNAASRFFMDIFLPFATFGLNKKATLVDDSRAIALGLSRFANYAKTDKELAKLHLRNAQDAAISYGGSIVEATAYSTVVAYLGNVFGVWTLLSSLITDDDDEEEFNALFSQDMEDTYKMRKFLTQVIKSSSPVSTDYGESGLIQALFYIDYYKNRAEGETPQQYQRANKSPFILFNTLSDREQRAEMKTEELIKSVGYYGVGIGKAYEAMLDIYNAEQGTIITSSGITKYINEDQAKSVEIASILKMVNGLGLMSVESDRVAKETMKTIVASSRNNKVAAWVKANSEGKEFEPLSSIIMELVRENPLTAIDKLKSQLKGGIYQEYVSPMVTKQEGYLYRGIDKMPSNEQKLQRILSESKNTGRDADEILSKYILYSIGEGGNPTSFIKYYGLKKEDK